MKTIKESLQKCLSTINSPIKCAKLNLELMRTSEPTEVSLQTPYTESELNTFWWKLDIDQNKVFMILGTIWLKDGSWLVRDWDHNGWILKSVTEVPKELIRK